MTEAGAIARGPGEMMRNADPGMLAGVRVIDLGAEVVKIEPPEGNATRRIGPFLEENRPGLPAVLPELHRDKKSVVLDLQEPRGARICSACSGRRSSPGCDVPRSVSGAGDGADDAVRR